LPVRAWRTTMFARMARNLAYPTLVCLFVPNDSFLAGEQVTWEHSLRYPEAEQDESKTTGQ